MKNLLLLLISIVIYTSCSTPTPSPMTIGSALILLDELERSVEDATNQIEFAANKTINNASLQLQTNIHELRQSILSVSDDINEKITQQQFSAVDNLTNLANEFQDITNETLDKVENLNNSLGQVLSDLPFTKNEARVTSSILNVYVNDWSNNLELTFKGYNLDNPKNQIEFESSVIPSSNMIATEMKFIIPKDTIEKYTARSKNEMQYLKGKLKLNYKKNWYSFKNTVKELPLTIRILPRQIGVASLTFEIKEWTENPETIVVPDCLVHTRGTGWRGSSRSGRNSCSYVTPTKLLKSCNKEVKGKIVPGSIKVQVLANRHGGDHNLTSVSDVGFTVNVHAKSQSKPGGGGGKYHVRTSYLCKYPCKAPRDVTIENIPILIGEEVASKEFETASEPRFKRLSTVFFDSTHLMLTQKDDNSSLLEIEYNESLKQLIIKPISIERN